MAKETSEQRDRAGVGFIRSDVFAGPRPGYVFKRSIHGVGYYQEVGVDGESRSSKSWAPGLLIHPQIGVVEVEVPCTGVEERVWAAGLALARTLCDGKTMLPSVDGRRIVELGSGTGLTAACGMWIPVAHTAYVVSLTIVLAHSHDEVTVQSL